MLNASALAPAAVDSLQTHQPFLGAWGNFWPGEGSPTGTRSLTPRQERPSNANPCLTGYLDKYCVLAYIGNYMYYCI